MQYQDFGGFYDREKLFWKQIKVRGAKTRREREGWGEGEREGRGEIERGGEEEGKRDEDRIIVNSICSGYGDMSWLCSSWWWA